MFSTIDKTFHNHNFSFQHTVTATPKITFTSQNNYFLLLHIMRNKFHWLTNYSHYPYQFTSNMRPCLPLHTSQPNQLYCTTHIPLIHNKNIFTQTPSTSTPKYMLPKHLVSQKPVQKRGIGEKCVFLLLNFWQSRGG